MGESKVTVNLTRSLQCLRALNNLAPLSCLQQYRAVCVCWRWAQTAPLTPPASAMSASQLLKLCTPITHVVPDPLLMQVSMNPLTSPMKVMQYTSVVLTPKIQHARNILAILFNHDGYFC